MENKKRKIENKEIDNEQSKKENSKKMVDLVFALEEVTDYVSETGDKICEKIDKKEFDELKEEVTKMIDKIYEDIDDIQSRLTLLLDKKALHIYKFRMLNRFIGAPCLRIPEPDEIEDDE